jgi:hypothetical protein
MRYLLIVFIMATFLCLCNSAKADDDLEHFAAHFGMSYAIGTFTYQLYHKGFRMDEFHATVFSGAITLFVGFMYKYIEAFDSQSGNFPADTGRSMIYNTLGWGTSMVVIRF